MTPSQIKMWYACVNHCKLLIWWPIVQRICHENSIFGLYTEYRYRNNAQMVRTRQVSTVVANIGRELSLLKMAINMVNADYLSFFLWNEVEPRCQQRAAGSLELPYHILAKLPCTDAFNVASVYHQGDEKWIFTIMIFTMSGSIPYHSK